MKIIFVIAQEEAECEASEFLEGTPCLTGVGVEAPAQGVGVTE